MNTLFFVIDKTYGGYDYIEVNHERQLYITGNTRAHKGHLTARHLLAELKTKKQLKELQIQLDNELHYFDMTDKHNHGSL